MTPKGAARLEDVRWMADTGEHIDGAAQRLGLSRNTLEKFLQRNDPACLRALTGRTPRDHNRLFDHGVSIYELTGLGTRRRVRRQRRKQQEGLAA